MPFVSKQMAGKEWAPLKSSMTPTSQDTAGSVTGDSAWAMEGVEGANPKLAQRWRKKTKQVATLGPASCDMEMIEKLFLAGVDVFRLNFSHGSHEEKKGLVDIIRAVEEKYNHPIAILGDLQGPKLRVGQFANEDGEMLAKGQTFRFDLENQRH